MSTGNGAPTLSISPRKVRQISDPIQQILNVLHKVIYITQLPPTLSHNPRRTIIDKFKRALFLPNTNPAHLKTELKKLANGSPDFIDINFGNVELNETTERSSASSGALTIDHDSKSNVCRLRVCPRVDPITRNISILDRETWFINNYYVALILVCYDITGPCCNNESIIIFSLAKLPYFAWIKCNWSKAMKWEKTIPHFVFDRHQVVNSLRPQSL